MLKTRVIPVLLYKDHGLVKGERFDSWRRTGTVVPAIRVFNTREVDEMIVVDISANREGRVIDFEEVDRFADDCFMPLTVGGGIRTIEDIRRLLRAGADKVSINTAAFENPALITEGAAQFGAQCIVVSIDAKRVNDKHHVFTHSGTKDTGVHPRDWAIEAAKRGAGEILLTSMDRDGTMTGYDQELIRLVTQAVSIPVIAAGGAGNYEDMAKAVIDSGCSAVAAGAMFQFTQQTPMGAKHHLRSRGVPVRIWTG